ncbi:glycyl-radical enzyme activating protein [Clostridium taeniosporum]|uniref:Glycyl-radical enzyme activating protein n=1 Tax=Clostridium taeniosporum TaxID=394958 RepID=A0A1D7XJY9_9CLOT|nr:glycyl-radical enzyme activating protein [Clostridium taeniosporum]AOR23642.1 glycyl-radical enzyme activating protein [Clostridium taeniosporum]
MLKNEVDLNKTGTVFNIQRFSVNDGPGIRTIVFLKGCPLSCYWCSNPESQNINKELLFNLSNCTGCHKCEKNCEHDAIDFNNINRIDRDRCISCGNCAENCYPGALVISGKDMNVKEVLLEINKDSSQFRRSNGGVTLSGGEPLLQNEFALEILKGCKQMGVHTTIETTGYVNKNILENVLPWVDLVLLDIKTIDEEKHKKYVGASNKIILKNAKLISDLAKSMIVRVPVIPEFNCDSKSIENIAKFSKDLNHVKELHLLPYHRLGLNKYTCLGKKYLMKDNINTPNEEIMLKFKKIVQKIGLKCNIGAH